eukprot:symbB.v1.2.004493.t2/scaffold250.1/size251770/4
MTPPKQELSAFSAQPTVNASDAAMRWGSIGVVSLLVETHGYNPELSCAGLVEDGFSWDTFRRDLLGWSDGSSSFRMAARAIGHAPKADGSRCPLGHLAMMWLQELLFPGTDTSPFRLILTKYVADRATLADVMWSSWPLPFLLGQVSLSRSRQRLRRWQASSKTLRLARVAERLRVVPNTPALGRYLARLGRFLQRLPKSLSRWKPSAEKSILWKALAKLQVSLYSMTSLEHSCGRRPWGHCPACVVPVQGEWVQEAQLMDDLWSASHKMAFTMLRPAETSSPRALAIDALAQHEGLPWHRKFRQLSTLQGRTAKSTLPFTPRSSPSEREAVATVLWTTGSLEELWIYAEVIATLARSLRQTGRLVSRPFLVLVPQDLPSSVARWLNRADGVRIARVKGLYAWPNSMGISEAKQLPGGIGPMYDWPKFLLWSLTNYQRIVFLDADTLPLGSDALEPLFVALDTNAFAAVAFGDEGQEMNNGIFSLRPSKKIFRCMMQTAKSGIFWTERAFLEKFQFRGGTWMAFLDLFWRQRAATELCDVQNEVVSYSVLPQVFNFPASLGAIFQVRDVSRKGAFRVTGALQVAEHWAKVLFDAWHYRGVRILHWVGATRKPWFHWSEAAKTILDRMWWRQHRSMCIQRRSARKYRCRFGCG